MTSKSSENLFKIRENKAVLAEATSFKNLSLEKGHLYPQNEFHSRSPWFKGSRDRGFKESNAA